MTYDIHNTLSVFNGDPREAENHIIAAQAPLVEALDRINILSGSPLTLFVADSSGRIIGSVTDGDIRRALLRERSLEIPVTEAMHRAFRFLREDDDRYSRLNELKSSGIDLIPVLDPHGRLRQLIDLRTRDSFLPLDAVLMAGGKGERLRPLTLDTPKPLLKVGDKPIIDYNVENLVRSGVEKIFVTVNYLKEQIIDHFSEPVQGVKVDCIVEEKRTGTFGSLTLVDGLSAENILVMNSDLLTTISFQKMYRHHISNGADLTMAVIPYSVSIPYAILSTKDDFVEGLEEKPVYNYFANAGVYILKRSLIGRIPEGAYMDAPDFIRELIADGGKVSHFLVDGMWIDIGSPSDYKHACDLVSLVK